MASVCVKPYAVAQAVSLLTGTGVIVGCVVGFPHGNSTIAVKKFETTIACADGAKEIDMVINIGKALSGDWDYVEQEIRAGILSITKQINKLHLFVIELAAKSCNCFVNPACYLIIQLDFHYLPSL